MLIGTPCGNRLTTGNNVASITHLPVSGTAALHTRDLKKSVPDAHDACGRNRRRRLVPASAGTRNGAACLSYIISTISSDQKRANASPADHRVEVLSSSSRPISYTSQATGAAQEYLAGIRSPGTPTFDLTFATDVEEDVSWQSGQALSNSAELHKNQGALQLLYLPGLQYVVVVPAGLESTPSLQVTNLPNRKSSVVPGVEEELRRSKRLRSLVLLNILAAIYGTGTLVNRSLAAGGSEATPASLSSLVRYAAALGVFLPALTEALGKKRDSGLIRAGVELGGYLFADTFFVSLSQGSKNAAWDSSSLLFAVSVIFVPLMEIRAGKSVSKITWLATFAALSGMGLLEEDGSGWKGISMPQMPQLDNLWSVAGSLTSALHILRSEAIGSRFDSVLLTSVQMLVLTVLSLVWEVVTLCNGSEVHLAQDVSSIPWGPVLYGGLVCTGLCSWLELRGLRWVHASTATLIYTTIPLWGALFAFLLRNETVLESAAVAAPLVLVAGFVSRWLAHHHDSLLQGPRRNASADHLPGAFLSSQLKFPYYAAQAQKLLTEAKMNVGAVKGMIISFGVASGGKTADMASTPPGLVGSAQADHLAQAAASALHGFQVGDLAASVMVGMGSGLDSAAVAVGSDLVQALEETEDAVSFLCNFLNAFCGSVSHVSADSMDGLLRLVADGAAGSDFVHTLVALLGSNVVT